ncbi:hypothetical protein WA158_002333 [Blastocystis sp. Blastoise]
MNFERTKDIKKRVGDFKPTKKESIPFFFMEEDKQALLVNSLVRYFVIQGVSPNHTIKLDLFKKDIAEKMGISIPKSSLNAALQKANEKLNSVFGFTIAPLSRDIVDISSSKNTQATQPITQSQTVSQSQIIQSQVESDANTQSENTDSYKAFSSTRSNEYILINTLNEDLPSLRDDTINDEYEKGLLMITIILIYLQDQSKISSDKLRLKLRGYWPSIADTKSKYSMETCLTKWERSRYIVSKNTPGNVGKDESTYSLGTRTYSEIGIENIERFICQIGHIPYDENTHSKWNLSEVFGIMSEIQPEQQQS